MVRKLKPCIKLAAAELQYLVRVEEAARGEDVPAVVRGELVMVWSPFGKCVCVTCGKVLRYKSSTWEGEQMQGGHFLAGRTNAIVLVEDNVHCQCSGCNKYQSGAPANYEIYMQAEYGQDRIDELRRLKNVGIKKWGDDELSDLRESFRARIARAEHIISMGGTNEKRAVPPPDLR